MFGRSRIGLMLAVGNITTRQRASRWTVLQLASRMQSWPQQIYFEHVCTDFKHSTCTALLEKSVWRKCSLELGSLETACGNCFRGWLRTPPYTAGCRAVSGITAAQSLHSPRKAQRSARSLSFFMPAKTIFVPTMYFFGFTRYSYMCLSLQTMPEVLFASL